MTAEDRRLQIASRNFGEQLADELHQRTLEWLIENMPEDTSLELLNQMASDAANFDAHRLLSDCAPDPRTTPYEDQ